MKQSQLFGKTLREAPKDEASANAELLERGGFVYKNSAGIYSYLPLGWRVLQKIAGIIREEINAIGGQELFMPALVEKKYMEPTGRWGVDIGLEVKGKGEKEALFVLGWTHEEILTAIAKHFVNSYKDLPFSAYQIQTKFRNEPRAKSGLLRGREFMMKDLYSFHADEKDFENYYAVAKGAYEKIFKRAGVDAIYTVAAGGVFTKANTHEFQVVSSVGEDTVFICENCNYAENQEISKLKEGGECPKCKGKIHEKKAIEVGNIFPLGIKYSEALNLQFIDDAGNKKFVIMGSYGIGLGRLMGTIVEVSHDEKGILWPESVAPFRVHLLALSGKDEETAKTVKKEAEKLYEELSAKGVEVLYDDRVAKTAGEKFADADLIGIPWRVVVSEKTLKEKSVEIKKRSASNAELVKLTETVQILAKK
ncbi:MAG: aminoacyl--tRNA ligase-related protein [bacterium]|nr:aminoacyl--tRNA ligase-related protein [bacterium]